MWPTDGGAAAANRMARRKSRRAIPMSVNQG